MRVRRTVPLDHEGRGAAPARGIAVPAVAASAPAAQWPHARGSTLTLAACAVVVVLGALALLAGLPSRAAAGWSAQYSGTTALLHDVEFVDGQTGWAVGVAGTIRATTDGGVTWRAQHSGTVKTLFEVDFVDAANGWIVGEQGTILHTDDGGATWSPQASGVTDPIYGVSFITPLEGWACGPAGIFNSLMLHTTDGGVTWQRELLPYGPDVVVTTTWRDVAYADATHGWFVGDDQVAYPGLPGVQPPPFSPVSVGAGARLQAVDAASATHAWAVGADGRIFATSDGSTWSPQSSGVTVGLVDVSAVDTTTVWALAGRGIVLSTTDGGTTWQSAAIASAYGLYAVDFPEASRGWIVGGRGLIASYGQPTVNRPLPKALANARVVHGRRAVLRYRIDAATASATATIAISRGGTTVRRLRIADATTNKDLAAGFVCRLRRGVYQWQVTAVDGIGNAALKPSTSKRLTVL